MIVNANGKITQVMPIKRGVSASGKEYVTQDFVMVEDGENPSTLYFNIFGEDKLKQYNLKVGMSISATLVVESREWNGKFFTSLKCIKCYNEKPINTIPNNPDVAKPIATEKPNQNTQQANVSNASKPTDVDDLPF